MLHTRKGKAHMFDVNNAMGFGKIITVPTGHCIFEEGSPAGDNIYVVFSGKVGIYSNKVKNGERAKVYELTSSGIFGEAAVFTKNAHTYGAYTLERTSLVVMNKTTFCEACAKIPSFAETSVECISFIINRIYYKEIIVDAVKEEKPAESAKKITINSDSAQIAAELFPFGIKQYGRAEPESFAVYLHDYQTVCPVCKKTITVKTQLTARLAVIETENDLHKRYKDFEPTWYNIWTCPHCYFSDLYYDFEEGPTLLRDDDFTNAMAPVIKNVKLSFKSPKTIDESITAYYIAIYCARFYDVSYLKLAKLWLQLSWLYKDLGDDEMYTSTAKMALDNYCKMYYDSHEQLDPVHEQACFIVMAELFILFGDYEQAGTFLLNAKKHEDGNRYYAMRADRRLDDVRELRKQQKGHTEDAKPAARKGWRK